MSVVSNNAGAITDEPQSQSWIQEHPWITLAVAAAVAVIIARIFMAQKQAASPPTATTATPGSGGVATGDTSGLSTDANGNPILYVPTQDTFLNYNFATNSYNSTANSDNTTTTTTTNNPVPPGPPPPTPTPPPPTPAPPPTQQKGSWTCRYTVVEGDTLSEIASDYGTTWPAIYGHNTTTINLIAGAMHEIIPGGPWNNIRPGEVLIVPCK